MRIFLLLTFSFSMFFANAQKEKFAITVKEIFQNYSFSPKLISGLSSMNDGQHFTRTESDNEGSQLIVKYAYADGKAVDTLYSQLNAKAEFKFFAYKFNADETKLMLSTEREKIYRYSSSEENYIYDLASNKTQKLSENGKQIDATFSPNSRKVAFVRDNNLFVVDLAAKKEIQITKDGKKNEIINGATDWVYEEEFGFTQAFNWSPDSRNIAYYKFDESAVKQFSMTYYNDLYPEEYTFKYPKAGEDNAVVSIYNYSLAVDKSFKINIDGTPDQYIPRINWTQTDNLLCIRRMNRLQNKLDYIFADVKANTVKTFLTEENKYYIDINDDLTFLNDKEHFVITSEKSGFNHIYLYTMDGKEERALTTGKHDVTSFYGIDEKRKTVYYQAAKNSAMDKGVYSVGLNGKSDKAIAPEKGTSIANFSSDFSYFINYYSTANQPYIVSLNDNNGKEVRMLENNIALLKKMENYAFQDVKFTKIPGADGTPLNSWIIKPWDFDSTKQYPVLLYVYGGPGSQTVTNSWGNSRVMWSQALANMGYIVVSVDNRGTGSRGEEFKKMTYMQLGKYEVQDQISAAKYLASKTWVDAKRIGIWGWSYGGYMSSNCISQGADVFKMAMAVAPVTNWRFYDSIYTERYMRTPQENGKGYDENSPLSHADKIRGKYLLVHGLADDNVHFQNAAEMHKALVDANVQFESSYYPNKSHGISGGNTSNHLFTKLTRFVMENL
jgi:dipeptidyl-peptidase-4